MRNILHSLPFFLFLIALSPAQGRAQELLTAPTARMDPSGTFSLSTKTADPYLHGILGLQLAEPLYIGLRQTAETSSLNETADRLYPGMDIRLRLLKETETLPAVVVGLQSAFNRGSMAGEYLALSKHYKDFDFSAGVGRGNFGSVFGGIEYMTPLEGLSIKAEWNTGDYGAEKSSDPGFEKPAPWGLGVTYSPFDWVSLTGGTLGADKLMATVTLRHPLRKWPFSSSRKTAPPPLHPEHADKTATAASGRALESALETNEDSSLPRQIGRAARHMVSNAGDDAEELKITPTFLGLRGPTLRLLRRDVERAMNEKRQGSPQEIWRNAEIDSEPPVGSLPARSQSGFASAKAGWWQRIFGKIPAERTPSSFHLTLDTKLSLSEEDHGVLYRTALVLEERRQISTHLIAGAALRLNLKDNLNHLNDLRPLPLLPVRGDVDRFAGRRVSLDRMYIGWMGTPARDVHAAATIGQLEEMYSGAGGEILYRPLGRTWAIGAEAWQVFKRDPGTSLNLGLTGDHLLSGHISAWYEFPDSDLTLHAKAGRYLAEDIGLTLELEKRMPGGLKASAFATATDRADSDSFGGTTHIYSGLRLTLPFGSALPGTRARIEAAPLGRTAGQSLDSPLPLYDLTTPFSLRTIAAEWNEVVE